ncbi:MAG: YidC/Oxa1 family membrane protein insertase [Patescibacteria group bacterium]
MNIFFTLLYQPLFNLLVWLYDVLPGNDIGIAIIAMTAIIRILLLPMSGQSLKSQKRMQDLQPKIEEVKARTKDNKEAQAKELMQLYKTEKVNPLSSCLPLVVQLVILIALYQVLSAGLNSTSLDALYPFVHNPGHLDAMFLGKVDLATPNVVLAVLAGIVQFFQARMMITKRSKPVTPGAKDEAMLATMNKSMLYFMPVITVVIGASLPGGLALYWLVSNLFMVGQQIFVFRKQDSTQASADIVVEK